MEAVDKNISPGSTGVSAFLQEEFLLLFPIFHGRNVETQDFVGFCWLETLDGFPDLVLSNNG